MLKCYTDINTKLRKRKQNMTFKVMINSVFGKTMENVRKHADIEAITTERRRNYLVSEPNYHVTIFFEENLLAKKN